MNSNPVYLNQLLSLMIRKIVVPTDYHGRVAAVREMQEDDITGMVDALTDFAVNTATTDFTIEADNKKFTEILKDWLFTLNSEYNGKTPVGIKPLAKEYFKERWKYSSFPVLKISKWDKVEGGVILPTKMFFVDGESIYAKDANAKSNVLTVGSYKYYLGKEAKTAMENGYIFSKPYGRWFDKYPVPYLIKRGVYHNWKIIESIKNKEIELLEQVIPYMRLIKRGTAELAKDNIKIYSDEELLKVKEQFQTLMDDLTTPKAGDKNIKAPIRVTQFDETIEDIIPDLKKLFDKDLFIVAEKNILAGLGFIDIVEAVSTSRRESVLNPRAFIEEVKTGVEDFKQILKQLVLLIIEKNKSHIKYLNTDFYISSSPVKGFMTNDFKELIRSLYDRGAVSKQTAVELIGEISFTTEVHRREQETNEGLDETLYPPVTKNQEDKGMDFPGQKTPEEEMEDNVPEDKKGPEKENYDTSGKDSLVIAPYQQMKDLPSAVKKLSRTKQIKWKKVFNNAYYFKFGKTGDKKKADAYAVKVAWDSVK